MRRFFSLLLFFGLLAGLLAGCSDEEPTEEPTPTQAPISAPAEGGEAEAGTDASGEAQGGLPADVLQIANSRGLTPADIRAAMMTYTPSGKMDDYYLFSSGGQSGNVVVVGVPSMRILKNIGVFTPESWQGYGYGSVETEAVLDQGNGGDT